MKVLALPELAAEMANRAMGQRPSSAERFAAMLEATCILLDAVELGYAAIDKTVAVARVVQVINDLRGVAYVERLLPYAQCGLRVQAGGRKGARSAHARRGPGRRAEVPAWLGWLRHNPISGERHHAASKRVSRRFGVPFETVRRYLPKNFR